MSRWKGREKVEKYDGEFSILGMSVGLILGVVLKDLSAGIFLGVICGIAMDWGANLFNEYRRKWVWKLTKISYGFT